MVRVTIQRRTSGLLALVCESFGAIRGKFVLALGAALTIAALLMPCGSAQASLTVTPTGAAENVVLTTFASGFPTSQSGNNTGLAGPVGIVFPQSGGVLVSDGPGNVRLFASDTDGQLAASAPVGQNYGIGNAQGIGRLGTGIYMGQQPNNDLVQLNPDGSFNQTIVSNLVTASDVVGNPANGHLYVSGRGVNGPIYEVDPVAKTKATFAVVQADGMCLSPDNSILYVADPTVTGHIFGYNTTTKNIVFDSGFIAGDPSGVAIGTGTLTGKLVVETYVSGTVLTVDLTTLAQTVIATGASRGEHIGVDPNGSLLITESDSIVRMTSVPEPTGAAALLASTALGFLGRRSRKCRAAGAR
jgi:hypothetical protein